MRCCKVRQNGMGCQPIGDGEDDTLSPVVNDYIVYILGWFVFVASKGVDGWDGDSRRECPVVDGVG